MTVCVWGGGYPAHTRHATFVLTIPALTLDLPSPRGAPQVDQSGPQTFPTKHVAQVQIVEFNINVCPSYIA